MLSSNERETLIKDVSIERVLSRVHTRVIHDIYIMAQNYSSFKMLFPRFVCVE